MPPRHTYWTILFGNQPTAFRSAEREELLPTFKQIQTKHPDAVMMWFARGRLWKSPEEARDTFDRPRYERPRGEGGKPAWQNRDDRPQGDRPRGPRPEWKDRPQGDRTKPPASARWPNKAGHGEASPKPRSGEGGAWRDKPQGAKPAWQNRDARPQGDRPRGPRPEWKDRPQGDRPSTPASARWPNKAGYGQASPKPRSGEGGAWRDKPQGGKPAWQNRDDRPQDDRPRGPRPDWKDRPQGDRAKPPASARWPNKPGYGQASPKPRSGEGGAWRDKPQGGKPAWQNRDDRPQGDRPRGPRPDWKDRPQGDRAKPPASARWPNKPGYGEASPKPRGGEGGAWRDKPPAARPPRPQGDVPPGERPPFKGPDKRGRDWRPGGAHKDPHDRFKVPRDVKRARFKQNLQRDRTNPQPPRKKKDDE